MFTDRFAKAGLGKVPRPFLFGSGGGRLYIFIRKGRNNPRVTIKFVGNSMTAKKDFIFPDAFIS